MWEEALLVLFGWLLGLVSSFVTGLLMFRLEGRREEQREVLRQRREDIRTARNWAGDGKKAVLKGLNLKGGNLSGIDLAKGDLEDTVFEEAQMWSTHLNDAKLIRARFCRARLVEVDFTRANLSLADFDGASLQRCNFTGARLRKTNFRNTTRLEDCIWTDAQIDETTLFDSEDIRQMVMPPQPDSL